MRGFFISRSKITQKGLFADEIDLFLHVINSFGQVINTKRFFLLIFFFIKPCQLHYYFIILQSIKREIRSLQLTQSV